MNYFIIILITTLSLSFTQDRSTIFNAGPPCTPSPLNPNCNGEDGYLLSNNDNNGDVVANKFYIANDYALERIYLWMDLYDSMSGSVTVKLYDELNNVPNEVISSWNLTMTPNLMAQDSVIFDLYNILTVEECITLTGGNNYWLSVTVNEPGVQVLWAYSPSPFYYSSFSNDLGASWEQPQQGYVGASIIQAEQIFYPEEIDNPVDLGDVNLDNVLNVLDIVQTVNYILGSLEFDQDQLEQADFNQDDEVNILDIVQIVNYILSNSDSQLMPPFLAQDINPASEYFGQMIGPETFSGDVSAYYFGKAGWATCRNRFGVLNYLRDELISEGINDIHFYGMNGFQYIDNPECDNEGESACTFHCMICDDECTSSTCDSGPRTLPWTQDYDDGTNCTNENINLCEPNDELGDVWDMWEITLRDLVILDRNGRFVTRINLTNTNPSPDNTCGQNYNTIKELLISIRNQ